MSKPRSYSLRLVVQHVRTDQRFVYRLVAYGDDQTYPPSEFESLDPLLKALHSVLPDFDESTFSIRQCPQDPCIIFSETIGLTDSQLSFLGLKDGMKS